MDYNLSVEEHLSKFMYRVFGFMALALATTAATAYWVSTQPSIYFYFFQKPMALIAIFMVQLTLVIILGIFIKRMPTWVAILLFFLYAISIGFSLSLFFIIYTQTSIFSTFLVASSMFAAMALYGYFTKTDLTTIGNLAYMGLFGLIIGLLINMYFKNSTADYIFSAAGVILFTVLTAYDVQKIKKLAQYLLDKNEGINKIAILGALTLYLDFINLFLFLLRFTGKERN